MARSEKHQANEASDQSNGNGVFDVRQFDLLELVAAKSRILSLGEYGVTSKVLAGEEGSVELREAARQLIYVDGDPAQGYRFSIKRYLPMISEASYRDADTFAQACLQWITAVPMFNAATTLVGKSGASVEGINYFADGQSRSNGVEPANPLAFLKAALEKGFSLFTQADAYSEELKPQAVEMAKRLGLSAVRIGKPKAERVRESL